MSKHRLTEAFAKRAKHTGSRKYVDYGDTELRGFHLRVSKTGGRSWFVRERGTGRRRFFGSWPEMSADDARARAIEIRRGAPDRVTVSKLIEHYRENHRAKGSGTRPDERPMDRPYLSIIDRVIGDIDIADVRPDDVRRVLREKDGLPAAQNGILRRVSAIYSHAKREGWFRGAKPSDAVARNPEPPRNRRVTADERVAVLAELVRISKPHIWGPVIIAAEFGCRITEARTLTWEDVSEDAIVLRGIKGSPDRRVPLRDSLREALDHQRRASSGRYVFASPQGDTPITRSAIGHWWKKARRAAGVEDIVIHDLRHERVTHWLSQGMPVKLVASIVGHADVKTTLRVYADVVGSDVFDALSGEKSLNVDFRVSRTSHVSVRESQEVSNDPAERDHRGCKTD